ncbi:hypothetical protein E4U61_005437 [Claviceps capensis]|nr:hypothetical protein E4U61_005437 [Claviceps capensis]
MAELRVGVGKRSRRPSDGRAVQAQRRQRRRQADAGNTRTRLYLERIRRSRFRLSRRDETCVLPVDGNLPVAKCYMLQPASANFLTAEALADGLMWVSWLSTAPNSPIRSAMCRTSASA